MRKRQKMPLLRSPKISVGIFFLAGTNEGSVLRNWERTAAQLFESILMNLVPPKTLISRHVRMTGGKDIFKVASSEAISILLGTGDYICPINSQMPHRYRARFQRNSFLDVRSTTQIHRTSQRQKNKNAHPEIPCNRRKRPRHFKRKASDSLKLMDMLRTKNAMDML